MQRFYLSDNFIEKYKEIVPNFGPLGEFTYLRCVTIDTQILCSDFRWKKAGDLKEGDGLIAFEEFSSGRKRRICHSTVTHNKLEKAKVFGIRLKNGKVLYATQEHKWLLKTSPQEHKLQWVSTKDLISENDRTSKYMPIWSDVWEKNDSYEAGYLATAFDGEGNLDKTNGIHFFQVENEMLENVENFLKKLGFNYSKTEKKDYKSKVSFKTRQKIWKLSIYGKRNLLEFLGVVRPERLLAKFLTHIKNKEYTLFHKEYSEIMEVWDAGEKDISVLSTTSKTHFTDGVPSHNTYSRKKDDDSGNEKWWETIKRVVEGCFNIQKQHCSTLRLPWNNYKAQRSAQIMYDKIFNFKFLPAGRSLWMQGTKFVEERGAMCIFNCAFITTSDIETRGSFPFIWAMDSLMLGVGVGADTKGADKITIKQPKNGEGKLEYEIPDSREGWVESVEILLDSYFFGKKKPNFNYDLIRLYGEPIRGFGGTASGPGPLKDLHNNIEKLLDNKIGEQLSSTDIVDIFNFIGVCVVAGNVRRSAEIMIGDHNDSDYITMKNYEKYPEEVKTHRWASNNSIFAEVGKTDYSKFVENISLNGEPGIVWLDNIQKYGRIKDGINWKDKNALGLNPCGEITLESSELCNLVETFPSLHDDYNEYKETLKYAYLYGKTMTLVPTHWPETNAVIMKNRRIGISQSGIIDAFVKHGRREVLNWCDTGYDYLKELDDLYSNWLCIPKSVKICTVKPSGTTSLLPGVSPGIHYPHAEYYIRRIRIATESPLLLPMKVAGYNIVDEVYGTEETKGKTKVVEFPVQEKFFSRKKDDATIWEQVKNTVDYQNYWADNNVSITVTFNKDEAKDIVNVLESYEDQLKAISFLPINEHGYDLAPYEEIDEVTYKKMVKKLRKPDFSLVTSTPDGERYCSNDNCEIDIGE
jgi:ribonucleoside-triphosphate reductase (thioredoxin)